MASDGKWPKVWLLFLFVFMLAWWVAFFYHPLWSVLGLVALFVGAILVANYATGRAHSPRR